MSGSVMGRRDHEDDRKKVDRPKRVSVADEHGSKARKNLDRDPIL
jgi:hypothetical protein